MNTHKSMELSQHYENANVEHLKLFSIWLNNDWLSNGYTDMHTLYLGSFAQSRGAYMHIIVRTQVRHDTHLHS